MWIARIWFLLLLLACAIGFAGVVDLPAHRDARVIEMADRAANIEAELIRNAVAAARDEARRAAEIAANSPRLHSALVERDPPLPPEVRHSLLNQAIANFKAGGRQFVLVDANSQGIASTQGVDVAAIAKDPAVKRAVAGKATVSLRAGSGWMAAVPMQTPMGGAMVALSASPARVATSAHAAAQPAEGTATRVVVLIESKVVGGEADPAVRATLAKVGETATPAEVQIEDAPYRARKYAMSAAPGMSVVLAWPVDAPTRFSDTGGVGTVLTRGLQRMPDVAVFGGVALLVWLLGLILANAMRQRSVRRLIADIDLIAAGPELEEIEPARVPAWLRPIARAANDSAGAARRRVQAVMKARLDHLALAPSEVSAERPMVNDEGSAKRAPVARLRGVPGVSVAPAPQQVMSERSASTAPPNTPPSPALPSSAPPLNAPRPSAPSSAPPASVQPASVQPPRVPPSSVPPLNPPTSSLAPPEALPSGLAPVGALPSARAPATVNLEPPVRSPFSESVPPDAWKEHAAEGTTELPKRRMGAAADAADGSRGASIVDPPTRPLSLPPADEDSLATFDRRVILGSTPPAIEDAEQTGDDVDSALWDMSLLGVDPEPTATMDSIDLPRARKQAGSLLAQLRSKGALEPQPSGGDRTVVRAIPMALLDASTTDSDRTAVGPAPTAPAGRDALERYYEQVFEEFLQVKRTCGEPTGGIEYRGFRTKLVRTRGSLMDRFNCVDVRFRVYVKDGRAALKAAPILDENA